MSGKEPRRKRRKARHEEHVNHERWLVSYADFITLLFAFFTVLYATAQTDQQKLRAVINGIDAAFHGGLPNALFGTEGTTFSDLAPTHLSVDAVADPDALTLRRTLDGSMTDHTVQIGLVEQTLSVTLRDRMLFPAGSADLNPAAFGRLAELADRLWGTNATVEVIGRADGVPLGAGSPYRDNWGLASARAASAARYLSGRGIPVERLSTTAKIVSTEDPDARAVTLRVQVRDPTSAAELSNALAAWADE